MKMAQFQMKDYLDYQINKKNLWISRYFNLFRWQIWIIDTKLKVNSPNTK